MELVREMNTALADCCNVNEKVTPVPRPGAMTTALLDKEDHADIIRGLEGFFLD